MKKIIRIIIVVCVAFLLFSSWCFVHSFRYPRIARSAYWRRPVLLAKATLRCAFAGSGVCPKTISTDRQAGGCKMKLLYLPDSPKDDKSIRDRVFGMISKSWVDTQESLFWVAIPDDGNSGDTMVYEYKTGKLVCKQDLVSVGGSLNE